jgi:hypothetical protein
VAEKRLNIKKAIKRPGAATRKAKAEGLSLSAWAQKHKGDKTLTGRQARFYLTLRKINRKR